MTAKKRKKQSKFRFGLHIYSSLLVFVAGIALIVLWIFLSRYQQGVDAEAAAQAERDRQAAYELAVSRAPRRLLRTTSPLPMPSAGPTAGMPPTPPTMTIRRRCSP